MKRMHQSNTSHAYILGTGSFLPDNIVTNHDLAKKFSTSDKWIKEKIGITERRYVTSGMGVSDMASAAAKKALTNAGINVLDLDAIVFATATPDYNAPGSGVLLQDKLGCKNIPAFDVRNTSPGFLYGLDVADGLIATSRYQTILVVGAEAHSTMLDFSDKGRMMAVIFGDGAGCFILKATKDPVGLIDIILHAEGKHYNKLWCEGPSALKNPRISKALCDTEIFYPQMDGRYVFDHAVRFMADAINELLKRNKLELANIDLFISHQANLRIINAIGKKLNIPTAKVPTNIHKYGNTSSASIPILYDEMMSAGKIKPKQKIVCMSFGSGFCWGAGLIYT